MLVVILNQSRKKSFRKSKRKIASVLPNAVPRVHLGDIPKRVLFSLIEDLRKTASRATQIKIFVQDRAGYHGWKCIEIGRHSFNLDSFVFIESTLHNELADLGWLTKYPSLLTGTKKSMTSIG